MVQKKLEQLRNFFRCPVIGVLLVFLSFFSLLAFSAVCIANALPDTPAAAQSNSMTAFPGAENEESAIRWDYRCRNNLLVRLEKRSNSRTLSEPFKFSPVDVVNRIVEREKINHFLYCNQHNSAYYRRLWQKILPTRAGPAA